MSNNNAEFRKSHNSENISERIASLSPAKRALLELRLKELKTRPGKGTGIPRRDPGKPCPLSFSQQRLWFLHQFDSGSPVYNITRAIQLKGDLNREALREALNTVVARHEVLRTTIREVEGTPVQVVSDSASLPLPVFDLVEKREANRAEEIRRFLQNQAQEPFDLSSDLMLRAALLYVAENEHVLLLATHHIASDGWSSGLLLREIATIYGALCQGCSSPLSELPIQYADFAVWQRSTLQGDTLDSQLAYWKQQLQGLPEVLVLPSDHPRPSILSFHGSRQPIRLDPELTTALRKLSQREGVTLFMTLLMAFKVLMLRYSGETDIVVGVPVANRTQPELENLIGFFVNNLVLRTNLAGDPTVRDLLGRVREVALGAYSHQEVPFEKLVEELRPERNLSHTPLFQVMFGFQNARREAIELPGIIMTPLAVESGTAKFDLFLSLVEEAGFIHGALEYSTDLFEQGTAVRMIGHYQTLLEGICAGLEKPLSRLPLLTEKEKVQLLSEWNRTRNEKSQPSCIHRMFELQVENSPEATALIFEGQQLTYRELNARANQLAHYLRKIGVSREVLVAISMERSIDMVIAVLGVLKAGGAYVPLDPNYPADRLLYMIQDAGVAVLLTQQKLLETLPRHDAKLVCLDTELNRISKESRANPGDLTEPENLAYVIYTSGSTGRPKGVQILHSAVVNFLQAMRKEPGMTANDVLAAVTTLSFDIAGLELFLPLTCGARVVIASAVEAADGDRLLKLLSRCGATVMQATPATWRLLLEAGWHGEKLKVLCGGEALPQELAAQLLNRALSVWNMYGPTETTIWSAITRVEPGKVISLGCPIDNTRIYILDSQLNPVPVGVPGELCIGGAGVARGYINRPDLVAEKFIPDCFGDEPGGRLYRTGDLARYHDDGKIEYLGRIDNQVKIRGFRIELGEIEAVLTQHPGIDQAVVVDREIAGDKRLFGYVVPKHQQSPAASELKDLLRGKLPAYMIPSDIVFLETLPLTLNGKVDRRALLVPNGIGLDPGSTWVAPRDVVELELTKIWAKVLNTQSFGVTDNFFDLGGHSLLAVRLFALIEQKFEKKLPLATLFEAPTIEYLARLLRRKNWSPSWSSLVPIQPHGSKPGFFCVHAHGGNVLNFNDLARHLGSDQPFYGLQAQGLDGSGPRHTSVEEMAAHYIQEIHEVQPHGPYFLGGYCFGGKVAFEMAQQLRGQGEEVALVALIDAFAPGYRTLLPWGLRRVAQIRHHWRNFGNCNGKEKLDYVLEKVAIAQARWQKLGKTIAARVVLSFGRSLPQALQETMQKREPRARAYSPRVYPGRITVFAPTESHSGYFRFESHLGWKGLAGGGLEIHPIPGRVTSIIVEPYVKELATQLQLCIEKASVVKLNR
jgi:amino acid adenylation domain-containing protein